MSASAIAPIDALPIVCSPGEAAANNAPATIATIGDLIAAMQDQADAIADDADAADAIVVDAMFGLQLTLRYATDGADVGAKIGAEIDAEIGIEAGRAA